GKAVVTGLAGEQEHGSALLHIAFDGPVREALRDTLSIIPSTEKAGPAGCSVDVPLHSKRAVKVRTHYDAMEVSVADGPRPDEIMVVLCLTTGSRPFPRVGGLLLDQVKGVDGVS
ncbi:amino acid synthesis family protein, partial [Anaerotruncus massiliensis (ex Liu et al. 2021)]|uniref:amino acid synthesis family protein n=2 Tax=Anaerotruncus TaxID=244127 RepID=UPI003AB46FEB